MNLSGNFLGDRRFILLLLTALLALVFGFFTLTDDQAMRAMIYGGYWFMLLISGLFAWSIRKAVHESWPGWTVLRTAPRWPAVLIVACGGLLLVHETYGFKILMDEVMLLGTSMSREFHLAKGHGTR